MAVVGLRIAAREAGLFEASMIVARQQETHAQSLEPRIDIGDAAGEFLRRAGARETERAPAPSPHAAATAKRGSHR